MNKYPLSGIAAELASRGRNGDTVLVHMNPVEVAGLASLVPEGLTVNPDTGQYEAFKLMETLIPMAAGLGLTAISGGTLAAPIAMGLGSGVATGAMTGDWERGLATGLIGAGTGMALGAGAAGADAAIAAGTEVGSELGMQAIADLGIESGGIGATEAMTQKALAHELEKQTMAQALGASPKPLPTPESLGIGAGNIGATEPFMTAQPMHLNSNFAPGSMPQALGNAGAGSAPAGSDFMTNLKQPWIDGGYKDVAANMVKPQSFMPMAVGMNMHEQMNIEEANANGRAQQDKEDNAQRENSYNRLQSAYAMAQPNAVRGVSADRAGYGSSMPDWWKPQGYAGGGQFTTTHSTTVNGGNYFNRRLMGTGTGIDPLTIQAGLRGKYSVSPHQMIYDDDQYEYGADQYGYDPADMIYGDDQYEYAPDQYEWIDLRPPGSTDGSELREDRRAYDRDAISGQGYPSDSQRRLREGAVKSLISGATGTPREGAVMRLNPNAQRTLKAGATGGRPNNYRAGFDPEFMYFQDDPNNVVVPESFTAEQRARLYPELPPPVLYGQNGNYFDTFGKASPPPAPADGIMDQTKGNRNDEIIGPVPDNGMAAGGEVALQTDYGPHNIPGGGVASLPSSYVNPTEASAPVPPMSLPQDDNPHAPQAMPEAGGTPSDQDIQMLALALSGQIGDKRDMVIERFIAEFGVETFREAREFILQFLAGGEAQTEGMIEGQGGGMDDQVMGTIGGQEGVAVSPGEYIVPADVVSGLGDGSSDAGAQQLDGMSDRVRMARGGSTTQPPPFNAGSVLPI